MEMLVLVFLLMTLEKNSDLTRKLRSALSFYRDNRELISMLARSANGAAEPPQASAEPPRQEQERKRESRASEEGDSLKILEEYLKRTAN